MQKIKWQNLKVSVNSNIMDLIDDHKAIEKLQTSVR